LQQLYVRCTYYGSTVYRIFTICRIYGCQEACSAVYRIYGISGKNTAYRIPYILPNQYTSFQGQTVHVHEWCLHTVHVQTRKLFSGCSHYPTLLRSPLPSSLVRTSTVGEKARLQKTEDCPKSESSRLALGRLCVSQKTYCTRWQAVPA